MPLYAYEPRGRLYDIPDIGLPSGNEVVTGLIIVVIAIPIGYLILPNSKNSTFGGLIGAGKISLVAYIGMALQYYRSISVDRFSPFHNNITLIYNLIKKK